MKPRHRPANKEYASPEYRKNREKAIERDHGLCQRCLWRGMVTPFDETDHTEPLASGNADHSLSNIMCLCSACHKLKTANELRGGKGFPPRLNAKTGLYDADDINQILALRQLSLEEILSAIETKRKTK